MKMKRFAIAALVLLAALCQADAADAFSWKTAADSVALLCGEQTVWQFHFGTNDTKPCFHPVALPGGPDLIWHRPPDHPWHLGLWLSWKFINGVNYWEEDPKTGQLAGRTEWEAPRIETRPDFSARIAMDLTYQPVGGLPALTEHRVINISPPNESGAYPQDWELTFTAAGQDALLDRTPLVGEPNGQPWGGYAGLSVRFARDFQDARAVTDPGQIEFTAGCYRGKSSAMDYAGIIDKREAGIAILDHPENRNAPSPWYAINDKTMRYFSPAFLCYKPHTIKAGQSLNLRYRLIVHPGRWDANRLHAESARASSCTCCRNGIHQHVDSFAPFVWKSEPPVGCPFPPSKDLTGILFTGAVSDYRFADTWYPTWAADGNLYSPWTDGQVHGEGSDSNGYRSSSPALGGLLEPKLGSARTGQAVMTGDDPLHLTVKSLGTVAADPFPYGGRYPCGSLVYRGVWYYGTYCLSPYGLTRFGETNYNWPWLGPLVGFRISRDLGKTWTETPHTPAKPLFGETGMWGHPVKIGAPHFVDFGKDMEHSPDAMAYLVAQGAELSDSKPRFENLSWITADQVYLLRVKPTPETINDPQAYEFFAGHDMQGRPRWTKDFKSIKPLLEWNNNMGCVTATYVAPLKKFLMCVTDGGNTCARMHTYILESDQITGPWKLVTYMKNFGEQAYFVNIPSKFISADGRTAWLCYSGNFALDWNGEKIQSHPPGSHYGLVLQQIRLLNRSMTRKWEIPAQPVPSSPVTHP